MPNYNSCPICTAPQRRELDSEIIYHIGERKTEPQILRALAEFCAAREITLALDAQSLHLHMAKHPLVGVMGAGDVRGGNTIILPSGEKIDTQDTKGVLRHVFLMGIANMMADPASIGIKDTLRIAELLMRPVSHDSEVLELSEIKSLLLGKIQQKPPPQLDTAQHPYAAPPSVGKVEGRE